MRVLLAKIAKYLEDSPALLVLDSLTKEELKIL